MLFLTVHEHTASCHYVIFLCRSNMLWRMSGGAHQDSALHSRELQSSGDLSQQIKQGGTVMYRCVEMVMGSLGMELCLNAALILRYAVRFY